MFSSTERATRRASADQTTNHSAANIKPNQTFGEHPASGPAPSTAGFHKHDILNKLDPRVDSTMDHQPVAAMAATKGTYGHGPHESGSHHYQDTGMGPSMHGGAGSSTTTTRSHHAYNQEHQQHHAVPEGGYYGPTHSSRLANTLDSHVDPNHHNNRMDNPNSDVPVPPQRNPHRHGFHHGVDVATNASTVTAAGTGHGLGAVGAHHNNQHLPQQGHATTAGSGFGSGHHVVHDVGGNSNTTANLPGPAPNTAGPHRSDLLNKLDPTVDGQGASHSGF